MTKSLKKNSHQLPAFVHTLQAVFSRRKTRLIVGVGSIVGSLLFLSQDAFGIFVVLFFNSLFFTLFFTVLWWKGVFLLVSLIKPRVLMWGCIALIVYFVGMYVYKVQYYFKTHLVQTSCPKQVEEKCVPPFCQQDCYEPVPTVFEVFLTVPVAVIVDPQFWRTAFHEFLPN